MGAWSRGVSLQVLHDFRRTAVRNLERAGVPRSTAMSMVGHRTESVYRRYAIVDSQMQKEAALKLDAYAALPAAAATTATVDINARELLPHLVAEVEEARNSAIYETQQAAFKRGP